MWVRRIAVTPRQCATCVARGRTFDDHQPALRLHYLSLVTHIHTVPQTATFAFRPSPPLPAARPRQIISATKAVPAAMAAW